VSNVINFIYLYLGSGAGGLTIAARLSEDINVNVGLIEAGVSHFDDPLVDVPGEYVYARDQRAPYLTHKLAFGGRVFGNASYDWLFETVPQANGAGRMIQETR
jgi:choline dehydrogenase-like flavoprotein